MEQAMFSLPVDPKTHVVSVTYYEKAQRAQ